MKNNIVIAIILLIIAYSCSTETKKQTTETDYKLEEKTVVKVKEQVTEKTYDTGLYELILSEDTTNSNLIVFIDPHGDGKLIYDKINSISNKLNSNIICLKNVENNIPNYVDLINTDIDNYKEQTKKEISNLYLVGFSGGARMAFQYANKHKVAGVVMCGAGIGNMIENPLQFPIAFIAGTADFNFNEQYYSPFSDVAKNKNVLGLTFNGKHEWPNNDLLSLSIKFLQSKNGEDISEYVSYNDMMNDYNDYRKHNEQFMAFKKIETINKIFATEQTQKEFDSFISSKRFKDFATKFEISLQIEFDRNNGLASALLSQSWEWWESKINEIDNIIKTSSDNLERDSYKRTRAYLGIVMFSVVNREIKNVNSPNTEKYLKIYEKLEPENEDMLRFKEQYQYQHNS